MKLKNAVLAAVILALAGCGGEAQISGPGAVVANGSPTSQGQPSVVTESVQAPGAGPVQASEAETQSVANTTPDPVVEPEPEPEPEPAPTEPRQYTVADITDLILVTGQSNALGADTSFDPAQDSPHERVFAFTEDGWRQADLHQVWDLDWFPRGNPNSVPSNNLALHMAKQIASQRSDRVVGFVLVTAPGTGIEHWDINGQFFAQIDQKVVSAINQLPHKSGVDGILWHQGENDAGETSYGAKLDQVIASFRQQNWFAGNLPFICGETAVYEIVNQQLRALNSNGDRWSGCVGSEGLETREDGFHFNAEGLRQLGQRYAMKYLDMMR